MKLLNLFLALTVALSSISLSANQKHVVSDAQSFVELLSGEYTIDDIEYAVQDTEVFLAELVDLRLITAEEAEELMVNPEKVLETAAPQGNASHYFHHHGGFYVDSGLYWAAVIIVIFAVPA